MSGKGWPSLDGGLPYTHHVAPSPKGRAATSSASGRCYRHHLATDRPEASDHRASPRADCHPARIVLFPVPLFCLLPSTVHALARSSLPSSSAVPVILRPDLVRSLSSVRPSVFLFLVPRSPSCLLTAKANASRSLSHQVTPSPEREGFTPSCSGRDTITTTSAPTSNRDGHTSARPSARLSLPLFQVVRVGQTTIQGGPPLPAHPADPLARPRQCGRHIEGTTKRG